MDRERKILELTETFLEEYRVMTIADWDNIILEVEKENFEEIKKELGGG